MPFVCVCDSEFATQRGLEQHQARNCSEFKAADASNTVDNALEKYQQRLRAKAESRKRKRDEASQEASSSMPPPMEMADTLIDNVMGSEDHIQIELPVPDSPEPEQTPQELGRGHRTRRPTWKILQQQPVPINPPIEPERQPTADLGSPVTPPPSIAEVVWQGIKTLPNAFGLYREYPSMPSHIPDSQFTLDNFSNSSSPDSASSAATSIPLDTLTAPAASNTEDQSPWYPFANASVAGLMRWAWSDSAMKSVAGMSELFNFLKSDNFKKEELAGFDFKAETAKLDRLMEGKTQDGRFVPDGDGWKERVVQIEVPDGRPHTKDNIPKFEVPGLHYRSITQVLKSAVSDFPSRIYHYIPFKLFWKRDSGPPQRVIDELYNSDAMIDAHMQLQQQPPEPGCTLERVVAGMMFWSDSTHLASFGTASLWPLYLFFGNLSKYVRAKPSSASCHHVAYIPKLPDSFFDFYTNLTGDGPTAETLTHCRRELMHAVWSCLLDPEFMEAYKHGIVILCPDGIQRRFYPRIFTYSADYPEKVLLATIRSLGAHPCSRCLIPKEKIPEVGTKPDARRRETQIRVDDDRHTRDVKDARRAIYEEGLGVKSAAVERLMSWRSFVPTTNAFSKLTEYGHKLFQMLVPDFMHEFELGVWKATFTHLLRILFAHGESSIQQLNLRYRAVPTFGRSTIRRFSSNASAMKKLAARDYEDLLQCAIPVFDGLLPGIHDDAVLSLLFTLAEWHCLGKLRLHTDTTLEWLDQCTTNLGQQLRHFANYTCNAFETYELPSEEATRSRRTRKSAARKKTTGNATRTTGPKIKRFNLILIKLHALGDYVRNIRLFGTSDSYSTQTGELEHRRVKKFYVRTNKNRAVRQMTRLERREHALRKQTARIARQKAREGASSASSDKQQQPPPKRRRLNTQPAPKIVNVTVGFEQTEPLPFTPPDAHHHISPSRNFPVHIHDIIGENVDPAVKDFYPKLLNYLVGRLRHPNLADDGEQFSRDEASQIFIVNERLYKHKVMRINYTTYDMRIDQDSINPRNHADIMVLSRNDAGHPFEYARVIGIFHVDAALPGEKPVTKELLWVRWYRRDQSYRAGFARKRLHRLSFIPSSDPNAFGFLDPDDVIRASHLVPAFRYGATTEYLDGETAARPKREQEDYRYYYVNIFVDRDMYMRYAGNGVGHYRVNTADTTPAQPIVDGNEDTGNDEVPVDDTDSRPESEGDRDAEKEPDEGSDGDEDSEESESEEEEESGSEPEDMGAEDGEGGFNDEEDELGYAPL